MEFITLFTENLFNMVGTIGSLNSSGSFLPTAVSGAGSTTICSGAEFIQTGSKIDSEIGSSLATTAGSASSSVGSSISSNAFSAYDMTVQQINMTQAYMESLSQEELEDLIVKLETKNIGFSLEESHKKIKKL